MLQAQSNGSTAAAAAADNASPASPKAASAAASPASLPAKRPSPLRPKPVVPEKPVNYRHLFQDTISIQIPLGVTADLGVAVKHTRSKRVAALHKAFPSLKPVAPKQDEEKTIDDKMEGEATNVDDAEVPKRKQPKKLKNMPKPEDYANILDYLEAKYAQGVQIDDEGEVADDDEGNGSVYSHDSFMDDADLTRNVAEQVLAHTTTTKLELQDDDEFFVNVGKLEVEETEWTKEQYDPLEDTKDKTSPKRKRKKPTKSDKSDSKTNGKKAANKTSKSTSSPESKKKKQKVKDENEKPNQKKLADSGQLALLEIAAAERKDKMDGFYQSLVEMIQNTNEDDLPRKKTKDRVSLTRPPDKQPGDPIIFSNPHVPGQRLKVKIPKNTPPGGTFKVTVPVADTTADDDTDYNKLSRDFYDCLDDFARAYDDWCDAEGEVRKASGDDKFNAHFEKRKKFDDLQEEFPKDLKTTVDKPYLQKIMRRARQNRRSKLQQAAQKQAVTGTIGLDNETEEKKEEKIKPKPAAAAKQAKADSVSKEKATEDRTIVVPVLCTDFPTKKFDPEDFA